jgi:opacity protein-like surface antigen
MEVMRCFTSLALAGAIGMLVATAAQAADMAFPPLEGTPEVSQQPVELGTGWYLRGDAAWSRDHAPLLSSDMSSTAQSLLTNGYSLDIGFGYKFNNWLRADIVYDYRKPYSSSAAESDVWCPYNLMGLTTQNQNPNYELGYYANPNDTCTPQQTAKLSRQDLLLNGYVDLGTWGGVTPYVGAGAGFVRSQFDGTLNYYPPQWVDIYGNPIPTQIAGCPQRCLQPQNNVPFTQQSWNKKLHSVSYHMAWALMGGFAVSVTDHLQIDLGYRYVDLGTYEAIDANSGQIVKVKQSSQEIRAGFRYMVD